MISSQNKENFLDGEALLTLIRAHTAEGRTVRNLPFRGVSMLPMLRQGIDTVDLSPLPEKLQKYDLPVYQYPSGKVVMHRVIEVGEDHYICNGDNLPGLEKIPHEWMIAVVTAFNRGEKHIKVSAPGYRLYSRLWVAIRPFRRIFYALRSLAGRIRRRLMK